MNDNDEQNWDGFLANAHLTMTRVHYVTCNKKGDHWSILSFQFPCGDDVPQHDCLFYSHDDAVKFCIMKNIEIEQRPREAVKSELDKKWDTFVNKLAAIRECDRRNGEQSEDGKK